MSSLINSLFTSLFTSSSSTTKLIVTPNLQSQLAEIKIPTFQIDEALPLEHIPLSQEEIRIHSLLGKTAASSTRPPSAIGDFCRSFLGENTPLSIEHSVSSLLWLMQNFPPESEIASEVKFQIEQLNKRFIELSKLPTQKKLRTDKLKKIANEFAQEVHSLQPGESRLLTGSFSRKAKLQHNPYDIQELAVLVYEFTKNQNGTYTISICSSARLQNSNLFFTGDKTRLTPLVSYHEVAEKDLFLNASSEINSAFFLGLLTLATTKETRVSEQQILQAFTFLKVVPMPSAECPSRILDRSPSSEAPSLSPTASLKVWISKIAKNQDVYRKIIFQLKFTAFLYLFRDLQRDIGDDNKDGKNIRTLLESSARNLLRRAKKIGDTAANQSTRGSISRPAPSSSSSTAEDSTSELFLGNITLASAIATAYDVLGRVLEINQQIKAKHLSQKMDVVFASSSDSVVDSAFWQSAELTPASASNSNLPEVYLPEIVSPDFENGLQELRSIYTYSETKLYNHQTIENYILQLPIPTLSSKNFSPPIPTSSSSIQAEATEAKESTQCWDQLQPETRDRILQDLLKLLNVYYEMQASQFFSQSAVTTQQATVLTFHAIIHYLLVLKDRESVATRGNGPGIEGFRADYYGLNINELNLVYLDAKEFKRIQEVHSYFEAHNARARNQHDALFFVKRAPDSSIEFAATTETYYTLLLNAIPDLDQEVEALAKTHFNYLTEEQIQIDYAKELEQYNQWQTANMNWEMRQSYNTSVAEYDLQFQLWTNAPQKHAKPTPPTKPSEEVLAAQNPGNAPPKPQLKVNIPLKIAKVRILMEHRPELLKKYNLSHLEQLNQVGYYCRELIHKFRTVRGFDYRKYSFRRASPYETTVIVESPNFRPQIDNEWLNFDTQFSHFTNDIVQISNINVTKRRSGMRERPLAEINTLTKERENLDPLEKRFLRVVSESEIPPFQLIYEARQNLEALKNPEKQWLFFHFFFRSPITSKNHAKLGAGELLTDSDDRALYDLCCGFISQGIVHFKSQNADVEGAKFFFEFAYYVAKYLKDSGKDLRADAVNQLTELDSWLKVSHLTKEEKGILHFYKALFYSLYGFELAENDIIDFYTSWIIYKNDFPTSIRKKEAHERLRIYIEFFTRNLMNGLLKDPSFVSRLGDGILKKLGLSDSFVGPQSSSSANHWEVEKQTLKTNNGSHFIHLIHGDVRTPKGRYRAYDLSERNALNQIYQFMEVFNGSADFDFQPTENEGRFRFKVPGLDDEYIVQRYNQNFNLYRRFADSPLWYKYCRPHHYLSPQFPDLNLDHSAWILPANTTNSHIGYITSTKDQSLQFIINNDKTVFEIGEGGRRIVKVTLNTGFASAVGYVDDADTISVIKARRIGSLENNPLVFFRNAENKIVWSENHQYALSAHVPNGYIDDHGSTLYLQPLKANLLPKLIIKSTATNRVGSAVYFCYNIENGNLTPTSVEAQLWLAYLRLKEMNPAAAIALITMLPKNEKLSDNSLYTLGLIARYNLSDPTPEMKMVVLHALAREMWDKQLKSNEPIQDFEPLNTQFRYLLSMLESINNISIDCRLPLEMEELLISGMLSSMKVNDEFSNNSVSGLNTTSWHDYALQKLKTRLEMITHSPQAGKHLHQIDTGRSVEIPSISDAELFTGHIIDPSVALTPSQEANAVDLFRASMKTPCDPKMEPIENLQEPSYLNNTGFKMGVIKTASTGSPEKIRELLFWLENWKQHPNVKSPKSIEALIRILRNANKLPAYIDVADQNHSPKTVLEYLRKLQDIATQAPSSNEPWSLEAILCRQNPTIDIRDTHPVQARSTFDLKPTKALEHRDEEHKIDVSITENESRWTQLHGWKKRYLKKVDKETAHDRISFTFDDDMLPEDGENYREALTRTLENVQVDYDEGVKINRAVQEYSITNEEAQELRGEALQTLEAVQRQVQSEEHSLIEAMNKEPDDEIKRLLEAAKLGGQTKKRLTFADCVTALLSMDKRVYQEMNASLKRERYIQSLSERTLAVLELKSQIAQLKRIVDLTNSIENSSEDSIDRGHHLQKLNTELSSKYTFEPFDDETQVALRTFAGQTGKLPYPHQTRLLEKMMELKDIETKQFQDIVIQLIMGGGKTSVLATILMFLMAKREGRSALFLIPSQLFDVVKSNLGGSLKEAFGVTLEPIDLERKDMTLYRLNQIVDLLAKSGKQTVPLISKSSTLQSLNLEFYSQALLFKDSRQFLSNYEREKAAILKRIDTLRQTSTKNNVDRLQIDRDLTLARTDLKKLDDSYQLSFDNKNASLEKLKALQKILHHFKYNTDAILDEVDQLTLANLEVNFPIGDKIPVSNEGNTLFLDIFKGLLSTELKIIPSDENEPAVSLHDYMDLHNNFRVILPKEDFQSKVVPVIAQHIASSCSSITPFIQGHRDAFVRFVSGVTPDFIEELIDIDPSELNEEFLNERNCDWKQHTIASLQKDLAFRQHVKDLYEGGNSTAAKTIYLARGALQNILPITLSNSIKRGFGQRDEVSGDICPFLGVNTPAATEFGYHWVLASYYYQWAAAFPPNSHQIEQLVDSYTISAKKSVQTHGVAFHDTAEYRYFFQLFGINLDEMDAPGAVDRVIAIIRANPNLGLELQFDNIAKKVTYYPKRLSSNGSNFSSQVSTRKGMSGDPWNVEGMLESMLSRYLPDLGTEGRIFDAFLRKTTPEMRLTVTLDTVDTFLRGAFSQIPPEEHKYVTGVTDAGALFKKFDSNQTIAKEIMEYLAKSPAQNHIKGVLFFQQDDNSDDDVLYVWKRNATAPEKIGGSTKENLLAHDLSLGDYFTYYAERNTTGTDIPQIPNGKTLFTFDVDMTTSKATQALMRYRDYLMSNNAYVIVTEATEQLLYKQGKTALTLILHCIIKHTINKTSHMETHFDHMIENIFIQIANDALLAAVFDCIIYDDASLEDILASIIETYEDTIVKDMIDDPYQQYGLKSRVLTKESLKRNLRAKAQEMKSKISEPEMLTPLVESMANQIDNARSLPLYRYDLPFSLDMQVQQQQQILVEVKSTVETKTEIKSHIKMLRQDLNKERGYTKRSERKISLEAFKHMLSVFTDPDLKAKLHTTKLPVTSIQGQLAKHPYHDGNGLIPFEEAFDAPIYGTESFFNPYQEPISFFSPSQRPVKQILVCKLPDDTYRWILLSERECHYVRKHMKTLSSQNDPQVARGVWLIQPDGTSFTTDGNSESFQDIVHFVDDANNDSREQIINGLIEINALEGNVSFLHRYSEQADKWLSQHTMLRLEFLRQKSLGDTEKEETYNSSYLIAMQTDSSQRASNASLNQARLKMEMSFRGNFVPDSVEETKMLDRPHHIKNLRCDFVKHLGIESGTLSQQEIDRLHHLQFGNLQSFHGQFITPKQVERWLPPQKVRILTSKEQICEFDADGRVTRYLLSREQLFASGGGLVEAQAHLIPYIDPEFYADLDKPWQIAQIPVTELHRVARENIDLITDDQIHEIQDPTLLHTLLEKDLETEKYHVIHGNLCYLIPQEFQKEITPQQISEISNPVTIRLLAEIEEDAGVSSGHFSGHVSPAMVPYIEDEQVQFLHTQEQISKVRNDQVSLLDKQKQIPKIKKSQVPSLSDDQIPYCPKNLIRFLPAEKIRVLPNKRLKYLREETQIARVNSKDRFAHLQPTQMKWISDHQYQWIDDVQVQGLENKQLETMLKVDPHALNTLKGNLSREQIQRFDSQLLIDLLNPTQIEEHLKLEQVKFLRSDEQILSCPVAHLGGLKPEQMTVLKESAKIKSLTKRSQIEALCRAHPDLIGNLDPKQIVYLPEELLPYITDLQTQGATPSQLHYLMINCPSRWETIQAGITEAQVKKCTTQEHFNMLPVGHIAQHATQGQVEFMITDEQIRACPLTLVQYLDAETQVPKISVEQVPGLQSKEQFQRMPKSNDYIEAVLPKQYPLLPKEMKNRLTPAQVENFDATVVDKTLRLSIGYFDEHGYVYNDPATLEVVVKHLKDKVLTQFTNEHRPVIEKLREAQVRLIQPDNAVVLANLVPQQIQYLADEALSRIPAQNTKALQAINQDKLHLLSEAQVKGRDLSWWLPKIAYRIVGIARVCLMGPKLVLQFGYDLILTAIKGIKYYRNRTEPNRRELSNSFFRAVKWHPKATLAAPTQVLRPERYWLSQANNKQLQLQAEEAEASLPQ